MKKRAKYILTAIIITGSFTVGAFAQEPESDRDLDRRVDVSREYMPDVDRAAKLTIQPVMNDTVALRPELDYTIVPSAWVTGFGVAAINPVRVDAATYDPLRPIYLKVGAGAPFRSVLDFYGTTTATGAGYYGGYINHTGNYSKLKNVFQDKEKALETHNSIGVFGRAYVGRRISVSAELGYEYDLYRSYAGSQDHRYLGYSMPRARAAIGNDFTDLSFFNFMVGLETYTLKDRYDAKETGLAAGFAIGKAFGVHSLILSGGYDGFNGGGVRSDFDASVLSVKPSYELLGGVVGLRGEVEIAYSKMKHNSGKTYFLPAAAVWFKMADGALVPFAQLDSRLVSNSFKSIAEKNPYIDSRIAVYAHPERDYKALAGIRGDISTHFAYEVRVGGGLVKDPQYFAIDRTTGLFDSFTDKKIKYFTAGVSLTGRISERFTAGLEADYHKYSADGFDHTPDRPEYKGNLYIAYNHHDRFSVKLDGTLTGTRYFFNGYDASQQVVFLKKSGVFDLGIQADYRINKTLGVFLSGTNLLNSKLYPHHYYRGFGIGFMAGAKLTF